MEKKIKITTAAGDFIEFNAVTEDGTDRLFTILKAVLEMPEQETGLDVRCYEV